MSGIGASAALALVLGWVVFALTGLVLAPSVAAVIGAVMGVLTVALARETVAVSGLIAVLAPFGVMLPALAARHMAVSLGAEVPGFATWEILVFLALYVGFLCSAFGVIPADLYRYGYAPWPVGGMVLALCLYAFLTGNWFLAGVAVLGQLFWVLGWGSSNWFDMVLHVALVPVAVVVLLLRLL
ncbi:hypothetical protein [Roseovarius aestuariivivens]|uniref:hypothetical protein n=1 Tax=Roseovarius aestuariivivens TaxID=1888910 RepID=UPI001080AB4D|nr:hypothetical protein [Roseovarius aestuariivivens]